MISTATCSMMMWPENAPGKSFDYRSLAQVRKTFQPERRHRC